MLLLSLIVLNLALGAGNPNSQPLTVEKLLGRDSRWFIQLFSSPYVVSSSAMGLQPHLWDFPPHWKKRSLTLQTSLDHLWTREIVGGSLWHVIPIVSLTILSPVVPTILFLVLPRWWVYVQVFTCSSHLLDVWSQTTWFSESLCRSDLSGSK